MHLREGRGATCRSIRRRRSQDDLVVKDHGESSARARPEVRPSGENEEEMAVYVEETARRAQPSPFTLELSTGSSAAPSQRKGCALCRAKVSRMRSIDGHKDRERKMRCRVSGRERAQQYSSGPRYRLGQNTG